MGLSRQETTQQRDGPIAGFRGEGGWRSGAYKPEGETYNWDFVVGIKNTTELTLLRKTAPISEAHGSSSTKHSSSWRRISW